MLGIRPNSEMLTHPYIYLILMFKAVLLLLFSAVLSAQEPATIRSQIDSALSLKSRVVKRQYKSEFDSVHYFVRYDKSTNSVRHIDEIHYPVSEGKTKWWIYRYHFLNDSIAMISKFNNIKMKDPRWQNAYYYFHRNILIYKEESGTTIPDIDAEFEKAEFLRNKFSNR